MYGVEKITRKLSWTEVTDIVRTEIQNILGVFLKCEASPDDSSYWDTQFRGDRIEVSQLYTLLKAVDADEEMIYEAIPCKEDNALTSSCTGMKLATALMKRSMNLEWDHQLICKDALWLLDVRKTERSPEESLIEVDGCKIQLSKLKSKAELMEYLKENGATHSSLMDFCEEYREDYQNELCWNYPISDGKHLGTFLMLVKEGIMSLPYDEVDKEEYELICLEEAGLFGTAEEMEIFIRDWHSFDSDLRQAMSAMKLYLETRKNAEV